MEGWMKRIVLAVLAAALAAPSMAEAPAPKTAADVLAAAPASDWRALDPQNTLYLDLQTGRVVIELNPAFAPEHVANIRAMAQEGFYDGLWIERSQENYVVQWGDPDGKKPLSRKPLGGAKSKLPAEFDRADGPDLAFVLLSDPDTYAPQTGFVGGFPAARDPAAGKAWLVHCYGMVGVGRDNPPDSGAGAELYAVNGQAPRHLDRNVALVGRVVRGMELLSVMPRGTGALGFYEKPEQRIAIKGIRLAADVPPAEREKLEVMRTDSQSFAALIAARRNRSESWFVRPAGRLDICNIPIPVRTTP
jgi:peptidylprolyl isomerase